MLNSSENCLERPRLGAEEDAVVDVVLVVRIGRLRLGRDARASSSAVVLGVAVAEHRAGAAL